MTESEKALKLVVEMGKILESEVDVSVRITALRTLGALQEQLVANAMQQKMIAEMTGRSTKH